MRERERTALEAQISQAEREIVVDLCCSLGSLQKADCILSYLLKACLCKPHRNLRRQPVCSHFSITVEEIAAFYIFEKYVTVSYETQIRNSAKGNRACGAVHSQVLLPSVTN